MRSVVLQGYADAAADLIERFEALSPADVLAAVHDHVPTLPSRILDIGAGTGRDAAWFAAQSHAVVAVEPVDALREAGQRRHRSPRISWIKDALPELSETLALGSTYDVILLSGVWQHLDDAERRVAFPALRRLTSEGGTVVMSLRHGPGAPTRPVFPVRVAETLSLAAQNGFGVLLEARMPSIQTQNRERGVTWTWLVLKAGAVVERT
ncbi:MAG: class I SAM-dependent methyltransferase [Pseudomonadota bacterium]